MKGGLSLLSADDLHFAALRKRIDPKKTSFLPTSTLCIHHASFPPDDGWTGLAPTLAPPIFPAFYPPSPSQELTMHLPFS